MPDWKTVSIIPVPQGNTVKFDDGETLPIVALLHQRSEVDEDGNQNPIERIVFGFFDPQVLEVEPLEQGGYTTPEYVEWDGRRFQR